MRTLKRIFLVGFTFLLAFFLSACEQNGIYSGKLILGGELVIEGQHSEAADIAIGDGLLSIEEGATLQGDVYQFGGEVDINGELVGNISLFNGSLTIGPQAVVRGDVLLGGGDFELSPAATLIGQVLESGSDLPAEQSRTFFSEQSVGMRLVQYAILVLAAAAGVKYFTRPVERVVNALKSYPAPSLAMGILVIVVGLSLLIQMIFTVLLIPFSIFGMFVMFAAGVLGWIAVSLIVGGLLAARLKIGLPKPFLAAGGVLTLIVVLIILDRFLLGAGLLFLAISIAGIGAVSLTRFGLRNFETENQMD